MISAALVRACATLLAANWSRSNFCLDMFRSRRLRNISGASRESETQSTIASASNPHLEIEQFAAQGRIANFSAKWLRMTFPSRRWLSLLNGTVCPKDTPSHAAQFFQDSVVRNDLTGIELRFDHFR
jgi:hypothetical protein